MSDASVTRWSLVCFKALWALDLHIIAWIMKCWFAVVIISFMVFWMGIKIYIATRDDWPELIVTLLRDQYGLDEGWCVQIYEEHVKPHLDVLREGICILAETAYVDFFYRDSYYHYFSSKLKSYNRDCLRLSLFRGEVAENDFVDPDK